MDELERLAQTCLLAGFDGTQPPAWLLRRLGDGLGGVVLYARNIGTPPEITSLCAELHDSGRDVVIAIDEEGGDVTRLEAAAGSSYPGNLALGQVDDIALTRRVAAALGRDLDEAGVDLDFAPVADVNVEPLNPVIGVRAFGSDPARVAAHVAAFVESLQSEGIAACAKHFPGHGNTTVDSHIALPTVLDDVATLEAGALVPFRAAIAAGVRAVMTAHIVVPAYDSVPATASRTILTSVLRGQLGFSGLIVTDAVDMGAITSSMGMEEATVAALRAGADTVIIGGGPVDESTVARLQNAIIAALRSGRLEKARLIEAAGRVAELARWRRSRRSERHAARRLDGMHAARRALMIEGSAHLGPAPVVVEWIPAPSVVMDPGGARLADIIARHDSSATVIRSSAPPIDVAGLLDVAAGRPLALIVRDVHRHPWIGSALAAALDGRPDAVVVETGVPASLPVGARGFIATFGSARVNLEAASEVILRPASERSPHFPPLLAGEGQGGGPRVLSLLRQIHTADRQAVDAVESALEDIMLAVDAIADRLRLGGRLHYFGAGTSGRLAALDAWECPATFGISPETMVAHLADDADEDDDVRGAAEAERHVTPDDAVVGISASGQTPYVLAALTRARERGARTVALSCVIGSPLARACELAVEIDTGPEVIAGSTRLKAGTAQKVALGMLSSGVFARLGHVFRGRMVDVVPANAKLRNRAAEIVRQLTGAPDDAVDRALSESDGNAKLAILMLQARLPAAAARARLAEMRGDLSAALGEDR
jgi:beta-N-acetylhexosaminidase